MKFEDMEVWKRSSRLSVELYRHLADLKDFGFNLERSVESAFRV